VVHDTTNVVIDIANEYDCPLYDPQNERAIHAITAPNRRSAPGKCIPFGQRDRALVRD
jgi:hypothetical protein